MTFAEALLDIVSTAILVQVKSKETLKAMTVMSQYNPNKCMEYSDKIGYHFWGVENLICFNYFLLHFLSYPNLLKMLIAQANNMNWTLIGRRYRCHS